MPKKSCVRTSMDSQRVKISERCVKSAQHYFCHVFWSLWKGISSKDSLLVVSEILRLFGNILRPHGKYSLSVKASVWRNKFKCSYLKFKKNFLNFLLHFQNLHKIWNTLKKKMSLIRDFSLKLWTAMPRKPRFRKFMDSQHDNGPKDCLILHGSIFDIFFDHSKRK